MTPRMRIDGEIGVKAFAAEVDAWLAKQGGQPVQIDLHTDGGSVTEGLAIYQAIHAYEGHTTGLVTGVAASMGSVILQAFDTRKVARGAFVMIHNPSIEGRGLEESDLLSIAARVRKMKAEMLGIYASRSGRAPEEIDALISRGQETWLTAEEAVAAGLADVVDGGAEARGLYRACARSKSAPAGVAESARVAALARAHAIVARIRRTARI